MSLNHNQFSAVLPLPGSEFATGLDQLYAISEYGGPIALQYMGGHAGIVGGAVAGESMQDSDVPNDHLVRPPAAPHARDPEPRDPEPGSPEAFEKVGEIIDKATGTTAEQRRTELEQELKDGN